MLDFFSCANCYKWSVRPSGFDERFHFVQCTCGRIMYHTVGKPEDYAYPKSDETQGKVIDQ